MPTTTNFGWTTPADTDLVKDGALAMRTLGNGIDTSMAQLKGGTTGQILSKTSNTDMAFTWINNDQGDLTAITAGTGITVTSGTGPVPTVALTIPVTETSGGTNQTTFTTGDILYASATNTLSKRAIGSTGNVLTVSGGVPTWAAPAGGGKVLQVVTGTYSTETSVTTSTYTDIGFSVSITPSATSSKVLVLFTGVGRNAGSTDDQQGGARLVRGSTAIWTQNRWHTSYSPGNSGWAQNQPTAITYLDSPSTTSSTTYKVQICAHNGTYVSNQGNFNGSTLTLLEIGA